MQFFFYRHPDPGKVDHILKDVPERFLTLRGTDYVIFYQNINIHPSDREINMLTGFVHAAGDSSKMPDIFASVRNLTWPLLDVSGQFSMVQYEPGRHLNICTDPIGMYPLYYYLQDGAFAVGTLLSLFRHAGISQLDYTGLTSKMLPGDFQTFGRRTVLKGVQQIMPGEFIHCDLQSGKIDYRYDTTLLQENKQKSTEQISEEYMALIEQEAKKTLGTYNEIYLALSGGIDSRIILAALNSLDKTIKCVSYGKDSYVDVKIARRLADVHNCSFRNFDAIPYLFPKRELAFQYAIDTDSVLFTPWLAILEGLQNEASGHPPFMIGDMCDFLRAKNIGRFKSRDFRIKSTIEKVFLGKQLKLTKFTGDIDFIAAPLRKQIVHHLSKFDEFFASRGLNKEDIWQDLQHDLDEQFSHIKRYNIEYEENFEELSGVLHHGRICMGTQVRVLSQTFTPISLLSNMAPARYALNINPLCRLGDKVTHKILGRDKYKSLGSMPTAQAPFVPYNSNFYVVMAAWAFRSKMDKYLTKKMLKKGKTGSYRLFENMNYLDGYTSPANEANMLSYFSNHPTLLRYPEKLFTRRKELKASPLTNTDITCYIQAMAYLEYFNDIPQQQ